METDAASSSVLPGRPVEYLKSSRSRVSNGQIEYRMRFRVEGQSQVLKVWRTSEALKKDKPLFKAFAAAKKAGWARQADQVTEAEPGRAVDCVVCHSFVIEDASHCNEDVCADCLIKNDLPNLLAKARTASEPTQGRSTLQLGAAGAVSQQEHSKVNTPRARQVRLRKVSIKRVSVRKTSVTTARAEAAREDYYVKKTNGICVVSGCKSPSVWRITTCERHTQRRADVYHERKASGVCVEQNCAMPLADARVRCEHHLEMIRTSMRRASFRRSH